MSDVNRKIANLIKQGNVEQSDAANGLVRVRHGELLTDWLPYFVPFAGGVSVHRAPSIGENCIVLSPSGEAANGLVLCGLASSQHPQPGSSPDETLIRFPDGAQIHYHHTQSKLSISGVQSVHIQAAASTTIDCPQNTITGALIVQGMLTYQAGMTGSGGSGAAATISGNVVHTGGSLSSNGVVLHTHTHPETNGVKTGTPQ